MAVQLKWNIYCVDEDQNFTQWGEDRPTECPNNPAHTVQISSDSTSPTTMGHTGDAMAFDNFHLFDGTDVWKITVDASGTLNTTKVT
jgi:hypothetical protein